MAVLFLTGFWPGIGSKSAVNLSECFLYGRHQLLLVFLVSRRGSARANGFFEVLRLKDKTLFFSAIGSVAVAYHIFV